MFYGGQLLTGCRAEDRPSALPGLPNLVFLDVRGTEQYCQGERTPGRLLAQAVPCV